MIEEIKRICELQRFYSPNNTPEMQERGTILRRDLVREIKALKGPISAALGPFGTDFLVDASDGVGRKTELPWVRVSSQRMSPKPTDGFYIVIHFATDGSAVFVTVGCGSSSFKNGSFITLPDRELAERTGWARRVVMEAFGTLEPFNDAADFGARRPLPQSFEKATALTKRFPVEALDAAEITSTLITAARYLSSIYAAAEQGRDLEAADQDEQIILQLVRPKRKGTGQGLGLSPEDRRLVELRAMELAETWLKEQGYEVNDHSSNRPYDFEAKKDGVSLKIEVKGTTSDTAGAILMTRNEVDLHKLELGRTGLIMVSQIRLNGSGPTRNAIGGILQAFLGWNISEWTLTPTAYRVEPPS